VILKPKGILNQVQDDVKNKVQDDVETLDMGKGYL